MSFHGRSKLVFSSLLVLLGVGLAGAAQQREVDEVVQADGFEEMMAAAANRMHGAMRAPFTGDPDKDFARLMIAHHQGAIDMAKAELRYGKDPRLKRLAQQIIVDQEREIAVMRQALGEAPTPGTPAPTQSSTAAHEH